MPVASPASRRSALFRIRRAAWLPVLAIIFLSSGLAVIHAADLLAWESGKASTVFAVSENGITATTQPSDGSQRLIAENLVRDFIFEFEFRQDADAPAVSVEFRGGSSAPTSSVSGYHCSLTGSAYAGPGSLSEPSGRGWLYPLTPNSASPTSPASSEWTRFRIEAIGPSIRTWVNGKPVAHLIDSAAREGRLSLVITAAGKSAPTATKSQWRSLRLQTSAPNAAATDALFVRNFLPNQLSESERAQGWSLLWDGQSKAGWRGAHRTGFPSGGWKIEQGELILTSTPAGEKRPGGDLVTEALFSAFEFQFDFLLTPGANSGVKYFVTEDFKPASGITAIGLEFQLLDDELHPDAKRGIHGNRKLASLYDIIPATPPPHVPGLVPVIGQWQHARIVVNPDQHVEHWLNGVKVVDYVRGSPAFNEAVARSAYAKFPRFGLAESGRILLQDHGDEVHFRSIKVRPLSANQPTPNSTPSP